ncbi:hypothetical protein PDQ75_25455 [Bacillus cereus group sp. Bc015]|uniref:hypothetical protein n=1 Tax=unclassified Bacillus cereus group TaxID=2750818 RepID=UPI00019FFB73|nr:MULTISPECIES: hypothetical protein [unclassified Bacillus cereus group]EEK41865.1 hypothetical protein bcere0001_52780 [Bacillus cereus m1293]MDA2738505.1 hypothetical protein [Bacillus cereus group sp. Bc015]
MAKYYGYCYDNEGKFTEQIPLEERPIYEKQTTYREELKEVVTEEKLCELHQSIEDGTFEPVEGEAEPIPKYDCPNCVMHKVDYEPVKVPYEENVIVGYEPDIPPNCTLEICPDLIYAPIFKDGKWVKTAEPKPEEPKPEEPSELEKLKKQMELTQQALDELLFGGK